MWQIHGEKSYWKLKRNYKGVMFYIEQRSLWHKSVDNLNERLGWFQLEDEHLGGTWLGRPNSGTILGVGGPLLIHYFPELFQPAVHKGCLGHKLLGWVCGDLHNQNPSLEDISWIGSCPLWKACCTNCYPQYGVGISWLEDLKGMDFLVHSHYKPLMSQVASLPCKDLNSKRLVRSLNPSGFIVVS